MSGPVLSRRLCCEVATTRTDMAAFEDVYHEPERVTHWYPGNPRYRKSGCAEPQIGDVAWCGHVKDCPPYYDPRDRECEACVRLRALHA